MADALSAIFQTTDPSNFSGIRAIGRALLDGLAALIVRDGILLLGSSPAVEVGAPSAGSTADLSSFINSLTMPEYPQFTPALRLTLWISLPLSLAPIKRCLASPCILGNPSRMRLAM
jgi:hypothetical protein